MPRARGCVCVRARWSTAIAARGNARARARRAPLTARARQAYYAMAREVHPDKRPDDPEAKEKFQQLQRVKDVLLDAEKRKIYDETGEVPGEDGMGDLSGKRRVVRRVARAACARGAGGLCCLTIDCSLTTGKSFEELYEYYRRAFPAVTKEVCVGVCGCVGVCV